ncbi:MAG TPA: helix-turn-helix domain-containing protein [Planctomycetota bacterium]|nr:helix-turn-helix domain-containing protein [Planctomycetota bacterium]
MATVEVDAYVLDSLMPDLVGHDRQPSAFVVYLFLWRGSRGGQKDLQVSLLDIVAGTGLSKRAVQAALQTLGKRRLVTIARASITAVPVYTLRRPWQR